MMELKAVSSTPGDRIHEDSPTSDLIGWTMDHFKDQRLAITTSFGMEGCALIDMFASLGNPFTVVYLDTMFFFPETYALRDAMAKRYPHVKFVNRGTELTPDQQTVEHGDTLWKTNPDLCCKIRKVEPMHQVLLEVDVWVTALRRSQSISRANLRVIEWDWQYHLLKVSPLAKWERDDVWTYIQENNVPFNSLHEQGYPTVGCTHCTSPVDGSKPSEYSRSGRWKEFNKTECGLHGDGI